MPDWRTILVPVDFSAHSRHVLAVGRELAVERGGRLIVVHVVPDLLPTFVPELAGFSDGELLAAALDRAERELSALVAAEERAGLEAVEFRVAAGSPHAVIVELARETGADLIVIATHGRTGARHLLIGSVAERVVRTAECPVLVVKPPQPPRDE